MPEGHQQQLVHLLSRMTYILRAGKCHKAISNSSCIYQAGLLTFWGQAMPQGHQQQLFHLLSRMTYILRAGKCHKAISNNSCIYQAGSLTSWEQSNATKPSATALASIKQDHLLADGRQMPQGHQQKLLHLSSRITYSLRGDKYHKAISNSTSTYETGSQSDHLLTESRHATRPSATALAPIKQDHLLPEDR